MNSTSENYRISRGTIEESLTSMKEGQFDEKPLVKEIRKISQSFSAGTEIQEAEGV